MHALYLHPKKKDVELAVLQADRYKCEEVEEEPEPEKPVKPVICPKCGKKSPFDAVYCSNCSSILDEKRAIEMHEEKNAEEARLKEADRIENGKACRIAS